MSEKFVRPHLSQRRAAADCINQALERRNLSLHWSRLDYLQRCADELTCPCNIPPRGHFPPLVSPPRGPLQRTIGKEPGSCR